MKENWDKRFAAEEYIYGLEPNEWIRKQLAEIEPCKILFPGEGEGRNAVWAAKNGFDVHALDYSIEAKNKALSLAKRNNVDIEYVVSDIANASKYFQENSFDAIVLVYVHLHENIRKIYHQTLLKFIKPGGKIFIEAFSKEQLPLSSGGPKNIDMLYSIEDFKSDFSELSKIQLTQEETFLNEGALHQGVANVIRLVGQK